MFEAILLHLFVCLVIFVILVDGGAEMLTEWIIKGLLKIVDAIVKTREYFTSRERSKKIKQIESVMQQCIETKLED